MRKSVGMSVLFLFAAVGAAHAQTWTDGQEITYTQPDWNGGSMGTTASTLLNADFNTVYFSTAGVLIVGGKYTMEFDSALAVENYIPAVGMIGPLDASLSDPTTSASGSFGGDVVALTLDVNFSSLTGASGPAFGNLVIDGIPAQFPQFPALSGVDGLTVSQFLAQLDILLGGGSLPSGYTIAELDPIAIQIEDSFTDGTPSTFAQDALLAPTTVVTPEPSTLLLFATGIGLIGMAMSVRRRKQIA